ncbi:hypothetical protein LAG73_10480 [Pseudoxanthomonas japonensis]|nr:hypothetical protein LAG73_10480 [Pseudoxanthomonas japonensis]
MEASKDAFRSLPALLREPWTSESVRPLYELINRIRNRMPYSATLFQVRWETIELLAAKPDFEANPLRRSKSGSKDPEKYPDPIITMRLVPNKTRQLW